MLDDKACRLEILANPDYVTPSTDQEKEEILDELEDQEAQCMPELLEPMDRDEPEGDPPPSWSRKMARMSPSRTSSRMR